jgi:ABC-type uncharacterized transport system involved in gliding motility auxiliary subunit
MTLNFIPNTVEVHRCDKGIYCIGLKEMLHNMDSTCHLYLIRSVLPPCLPTSSGVLAITELLRIGSTDEKHRCYVDLHDHKFNKISQSS